MTTDILIEKYFAEFCVLRLYWFGEKKERRNVVGKKVRKNN